MIFLKLKFDFTFFSVFDRQRSVSIFSVFVQPSWKFVERTLVQSRDLNFQYFYKSKNLQYKIGFLDQTYALSECVKEPAPDLTLLGVGLGLGQFGTVSRVWRDSQLDGSDDFS